MQARRVVVTGGGGFIGSHIVDALLKHGDEVLVIDNFSTGRRENLRAASSSSKLKVLEADIASREAFDALLQFKPQAVYHLAAQMNVRRSVAEPQFDAHSNVLGTVNLLEASRQAGIEHFIFASTGGAIYGEQEYFPADEKHPIHPECPYGAAKKCGEIYLDYFSRTYHFCGVALRFGNVYGPRQNPKGEAGVVAIFSERLLDGRELVINGDGEQTRDYIYVGDVVEAVIRASSLSEGFHVFNVGWGRELSLLDLVASMKRAWANIRKDGDREFSPVRHGPPLPGEQRRSVISPALIGSALGWQPKMSFDEGLEKTIASFRG